MDTRRRLLVVDDEKYIVTLTLQLLEDEGYTAQPAYSGAEALQIIETAPVHIMITDIRMPGMNGIELIEKAKQLNQEILIIVLTGHGDIDTAIAAMKKGTLNYLRKPVNFDELLVTIRHAFDLLDLREQLEKKTSDLVESNRKLTQALSEIKQLSRFLPICSACKKIRDDEGYWNQIESYIEAHTDSVFSHSLCPDCSERLYGNEPWYDALKEEPRFPKKKKDG